MIKSPAGILTGREFARVHKVTCTRIGRRPDMSKQEFVNELWTTARELYPHKITESSAK